ncbi:MAG: hypothetical protein Q8Q60_01910 [Candidatus Chromulinivorax sp.]|nr:hypothetical protein [Candidatus Chromulinivorax sp.]
MKQQFFLILALISFLPICASSTNSSSDNVSNSLIVPLTALSLTVSQSLAVNSEEDSELIAIHSSSNSIPEVVVTGNPFLNLSVIQPTAAQMEASKVQLKRKREEEDEQRMHYVYLSHGIVYERGDTPRSADGH